jgi:hypothetical protein
VQLEQAEPLPAPDPQGVIELRSSGPYLAASVATVGPLVIRGRADSPAEILIANQPCTIVADTLRIEHVRFRIVSPSVRPVALLRVTAQLVDMADCVLDSTDPRGDGSTSPSPISALAWQVADEGDARGGRLTVSDSVLSGAGPAIYVSGVKNGIRSSGARTIALTNCLKTGAGPLFHLALPAPPQTGKRVQFQLQAITCRASGPLVRWDLPAAWKQPGTMSVDAHDCVFDLAESTGGLFEFSAPGARSDLVSLLRMAGEGSVIREGVPVAAAIDAAAQSAVPLDELEFQIEGLSASPLEFAGPPSRRPADSRLLRFEGARRSGQAPGIQVTGEQLKRAALE